MRRPVLWLWLGIKKPAGSVRDIATIFRGERMRFLGFNLIDISMTTNVVGLADSEH